MTNKDIESWIRRTHDALFKDDTSENIDDYLPPFEEDELTEEEALGENYGEGEIGNDYHAEIE